MSTEQPVSTELFIKSYGSLLSAVQEAGGTISGFILPPLKSMSAIDLLTILARNSIEFKYVKEKK